MTSPEPTDHELVARMNALDERAFEILYVRHRDWVFRMAWRIVGEQQLAEDVLQEVFKYFLGKFPGFELTCQLRTFLYPAVRNTALSLVKNQRRFVSGEEAAVTISQLVSSERKESSSDDLINMVAKLKPDHREMVMLRFVDGRTLPEIAELIGIPVGTAKSRLHHALKSLRSEPNVIQMAESMSEKLNQKVNGTTA